MLSVASWLRGLCGTVDRIRIVTCPEAERFAGLRRWSRRERFELCGCMRNDAVSGDAVSSSSLRAGTRRSGVLAALGVPMPLPPLPPLLPLPPPPRNGELMCMWLFSAPMPRGVKCTLETSVVMMAGTDNVIGMLLLVVVLGASPLMSWRRSANSILRALVVGTPGLARKNMDGDSADSGDEALGDLKRSGISGEIGSRGVTRAPRGVRRIGGVRMAFR